MHSHLRAVLGWDKQPPPPNSIFCLLERRVSNIFQTLLTIMCLLSLIIYVAETKSRTSAPHLRLRTKQHSCFWISTCCSLHASLQMTKICVHLTLFRTYFSWTLSTYTSIATIRAVFVLCATFCHPWKAMKHIKISFFRSSWPSRLKVDD